ncbi:DUF1580 domain-containing protein [Phycisphaerales bacterium AB-hyl4]|uniref:DUF1580 domain-containing protein n=1 Tax=Natronomicrosphaera hydrolytica TaxID=3242702 RepID=A0ABV4U258_9BACT
MSEKHIQSSGKYITLAEAAKLAPGRPSANAVWRWARKGVKSRCGHRVHLQHVRAGGRVLTTAEWVEQFARDLAEADAEHFSAAEFGGHRRQQVSRTHRNEHDQARQRLAAKGLI